MQKITLSRAIDILKHLEKTNQAFCFVDGTIVDRERLEKIICENIPF